MLDLGSQLAQDEMKNEEVAAYLFARQLPQQGMAQQSGSGVLCDVGYSREYICHTTCPHSTVSRFAGSRVVCGRPELYRPQETT